MHLRPAVHRHVHLAHHQAAVLAHLDLHHGGDVRHEAVADGQPQAAARFELAPPACLAGRHLDHMAHATRIQRRSEEHTSELQSLMRISYAVFCLKKQTTTNIPSSNTALISRTRNTQSTSIPYPL